MAGKLQKMFIQVEGMSCEHCRQVIESSVKTLEGVTGAEASLVLNQVEIIFDPQTVSRTELEEAIENAGYQVLA